MSCYLDLMKGTNFTSTEVVHCYREDVEPNLVAICPTCIKKHQISRWHYRGSKISLFIRCRPDCFMGDTLRYFSLDKWAVRRAKGLRNGKRLHRCRVSPVMIYNSLHLQYEVCRCRWDMHWNWVSECERIQLCEWLKEQLDGQRMNS